MQLFKFSAMPEELLYALNSRPNISRQPKYNQSGEATTPAWHIWCTMMVQSFVRMILVVRCASECRLELLAANYLFERSAIAIQQSFRQYLVRLKLFRAATQIHNVAREFLSRIAFMKLS